MKRLVPVAVAFCVLLVLVVVRELGRPRAAASLSEEARLEPLAAEPFRPEDVAVVEVEPPGPAGKAFSVRRRGEGEAATWVVDAPFAAPASAGAVSKLAKDVADALGELRSDDAAATAQYDLTPDRATTVTLRDAAGKQLAQVAVGRSAGPQGAFVRILTDKDRANRVYEVTTDLRGDLGLGRTAATETEPPAPDPAHFRDTEIAPVDTSKAKRLEVVAPGRTVAFEKSGTEWKVVEGGPGLPVNTQGLTDLLNEVAGRVRPTGLADPAKRAELGLEGDAAPYRVTVIGEDGKSHALLGAADAAREHFYLRLGAPTDPDVLYEMSQWSWQKVFPTGASLFKFETLPVEETSLRRVVVEHPGGTKPQPTLELTRAGPKPQDDWTLVRPAWPLAPRQSSLRSLAGLVRNLRPSDYVDATDLGPEEIVVRFGGADTAPADLAAVRIGGVAPGTAKDRLAVLPDHPERVVVLPESTVERLAPAVGSLFEPRALHGWQADDVKAVRVAGAREPYAVERDETGSGWTVVRGEDRTPADPAKVAAWLDRLVAAEARDPAPSDQAAGAAEGETVVTLERTEGAPAELRLADGRARMDGVAFDVTANDLAPDVATLLPAASPAPKEEPATAPEQGDDTEEKAPTEDGGK